MTFNDLTYFSDKMKSHNCALRNTLRKNLRHGVYRVVTQIGNILVVSGYYTQDENQSHKGELWTVKFIRVEGNQYKTEFNEHKFETGETSHPEFTVVKTENMLLFYNDAHTLENAWVAQPNNTACTVIYIDRNHGRGKEEWRDAFKKCINEGIMCV